MSANRSRLLVRQVGKKELIKYPIAIPLSIEGMSEIFFFLAKVFNRGESITLVPACFTDEYDGSDMVGIVKPMRPILAFGAIRKYVIDAAAVRGVSPHETGSVDVQFYNHSGRSDVSECVVNVAPNFEQAVPLISV
eukprot:819395-Pyramimonas_sp.AAC.1